MLHARLARRLTLIYADLDFSYLDEVPEDFSTELDSSFPEMN